MTSAERTCLRNSVSYGEASQVGHGRIRYFSLGLDWVLQNNTLVKHVGVLEGLSYLIN